MELAEIAELARLRKRDLLALALAHGAGIERFAGGGVRYQIEIYERHAAARSDLDVGGLELELAHPDLCAVRACRSNQRQHRHRYKKMAPAPTERAGAEVRDGCHDPISFTISAACFSCALKVSSAEPSR